MKPIATLKKLSVISTVSLACLGSWAATGSYTTDVVPAGYYDLLSWSFQAKDLNHIFNTNDDTILISVYSNGTYSSSYSLGYGFTPNFLLQPGQAFFIYNWGISNRAYTLSGSLVTNGSVWLSLTNSDWNPVGPAFLSTNSYLECVNDNTNNQRTPLFTRASWNYHSTTNDLVYQWSIQNQTWVMNQVVLDPRGLMEPYYTNCIYGTSPTVCPGRGFFIKPSVSKWWTQYSTSVCCNTNNCVNSGPWNCPP